MSSYNFRYQRIVCLVLSSLWLLHSLGIIAYIWCELKDIRNIDARKMFEFWPESVDGFPTDKLKVDQAYLNITSTVDKRLWIYTLSSECVAVSTFELCFTSAGITIFSIILSVRSSCFVQKRFHQMVM